MQDMTKVIVHMNVLGNNPDRQTMLWVGRMFDDIGTYQQHEGENMRRTTIGALCADGILDEVSRCGMADDRTAWLFDNSNGKDGVFAVLVEVAL